MKKDFHVSLGITKNIGNYESFRIEVGATYDGETKWEEAWEEVDNELDNKIKEVEVALGLRVEEDSD